MRSVRADVVAYLKRTEGRLTQFAVAAAVSAIVVGVIGMATVRDRQDLLDNAVDQRGALTAAALDVYQTLADADAASLNAVLVDQQRAPELRQKYREDIFDAADALRAAAARDSDSAERVRTLTGLLPEYSRLVETGWTNSRENQPVGTSYLAQASTLVRATMLTTAADLHREQTDALKSTQSEATQPTWLTFAAGVLFLALLVAAQRFLTRRTRRKFNGGLAAATALTAVALLWLATALVVAAGHADDSAHELDDLVAPLAEARNIGREADGDEARILIFPKVGDLTRLRDNLAEIDTHIAEARTHAASGEERDQIDLAAAALHEWREADKALLDQPNPPPTYQDVAALITAPPPNHTDTHAQQLDHHLTEAIRTHTAHSAQATVSARGALAGLNWVFAALMALAAAAAVAGLWPRIAEYYR